MRLISRTFRQTDRINAKLASAPTRARMAVLLEAHAWNPQAAVAAAEADLARLQAVAERIDSALKLTNDARAHLSAETADARSLLARRRAGVMADLAVAENNLRRDTEARRQAVEALVLAGLDQHDANSRAQPSAAHLDALRKRAEVELPGELDAIDAAAADWRSLAVEPSMAA